MKADPLNALQQLEAALSRWENEGGARAQGPPSEHFLHLEICQSLITELEHLHIRMIPTENLLITLLARASDRPRELGREMATFISPRPGFTHHPRTLGAAAQMVHLVERSRHLKGWVEGDVLS
jgi:hypothetical protein